MFRCFSVPSSSSASSFARASLLLSSSSSSSSLICFDAKRNFQAHYGATIRSHEQMLNKFVFKKEETKKRCADGEEFSERVLPLLERVEDRLALWKRQKWEFRTPALLSPSDKIATTGLLRRLQSTAEVFTAKRQQMVSDSELCSQILNVPVEQVRVQTRSWLQKQIANLRNQQGRHEDAKLVREAWLRMESLGGMDYNLLERLVFVYGLGKMGTFDRTFQNTITLKNENNLTHQNGNNSSGEVVHNESGLIQFDNSDPLSELLEMILVNIPDIHILYDFLGWTDQKHYAASLGEYMVRCLDFQKKNEQQNSSSNNNSKKNLTSSTFSSSSSSSIIADQEEALLYSDAASKTYLMKTAYHQTTPSSSDHEDPSLQNGITKSRCYALWNGPTLTLVLQANQNKWLRQHQMPHAKQLEGMCRRSAFVLGYSLDDVRVRTLLLPPESIDRRSLLRLHAALTPDTSIATEPSTSARDKKRLSSTQKQREEEEEEDIFDEDSILFGEQDAKMIKRIPSEFRSWVSLYKTDIQEQDEDFMVVSATKPNEEWFKL